jgi:hypothetical protein
MHRILPGLGIGGRYLADFSETVAPALGLAQLLAAGQDLDDGLGSPRHLLGQIDDLAVAHLDADSRLSAAENGAKTHVFPRFSSSPRA